VKLNVIQVYFIFLRSKIQLLCEMDLECTTVIISLILVLSQIQIPGDGAAACGFDMGHGSTAQINIEKIRK
jgi:hypothetical protein